MPSHYDEFGLFAENAVESGLPHDGPPTVSRQFVVVDDDRSVSALRWGSGPPELVLLHGGAQNAHTWDTTLLALGRAALAIDLPGHGHSGRRDDGRYDPRTSAAAMAAVIEEVCDGPILLVGMSLGGLTANAVAAAHPDLVRRMVIVDITPGVNADKAKQVHDFIAGPQTFAGFEEILARTIEFNPTRSASSLRRGILHNAHRTDDGSWEWNYDRRQLDGVDMPSMGDLWDDISTIDHPYLLVRGGVSPVVDDADVAELQRRMPQARVTTVAGAGHSVQGDAPLELAGILRAELG